MAERTDIHRYTDPGQDGEEAEGDGGSCSVGALGQRQLLRRGCLPLIGQKAEADKPQEAGNTWRRDKEPSKLMSGVMYLHEKGLFIKNWYFNHLLSTFPTTILQSHIGRKFFCYIEAI